MAMALVKCIGVGVSIGGEGEETERITDSAHSAKA